MSHLLTLKKLSSITSNEPILIVEVAFNMAYKVLKLIRCRNEPIEFITSYPKKKNFVQFLPNCWN